MKFGNPETPTDDFWNFIESHAPGQHEGGGSEWPQATGAGAKPRSQDPHNRRWRSCQIPQVLGPVCYEYNETEPVDNNNDAPVSEPDNPIWGFAGPFLTTIKNGKGH